MTHSSRSVYRHSELSRAIAPKSIAVVGASQREASFGLNTMNNLANWGGRVYAVNERYSEIAGRKCYPSLAALPESPDLVISAVPRPAVEQVALDSAACKAGGLLVFASGYSETGVTEYRAQQQRLGEIAREKNLRIIGPNCVGFLNHTASLIVSFSLGMDIGYSGERGLGIASQSGAMGNAVAQASHLGLPITHMLAAGNSCDVNIADYIAYLAEDDKCGVIVTLFEGVAEPRLLLEAADIANARGKPIIVCKIATSSAGSSSALSHTGVLAGSKAVYEALFRRMNVVMVDDLESIAHTASYLLKTPRPSRGGVVAVATSGGNCTVVADKAEKYGVPLEPPHASKVAKVKPLVPEFAHIGNPSDLTAQRPPQTIADVMSIMLEDDQYSTLVAPFTFSSEGNTKRISAFNEVGIRQKKPVCFIWATAWMGGIGWDMAHKSESLVVFRSTDDCFRTIASGQAYERGLTERKAEKDSPRVAIDAKSRATAADLLARAGQGASMSERASKDVLKLYGVPMVEEKLVRSADEAVAAAASLGGFPLVLKLEVEGLAHKTEAGGVAVDLRNEAEVRQAYADLMQAVERHGLRAGFKGVLVQPMVKKGVEIIVGARIDPLFGPTVVVGMGGTMVEVMQDSVVELAPVTQAQAESMLRGLRGHKMLTGVRGSKPVDEKALAQVLCRVSEFAADHADKIAEIDINPLVCGANRIVAVDALVVTK